MKEEMINSFNRIALLEDKWDHNQHYEKLLLREVRNPEGVALDIGCGTGELAHRLAQKVKQVYGIDLSPVMIEEAKKRHPADNIQYELQDFDELDEELKYDYIVSVATFHHLDLETALPKINKLLKESGVLMVLDLYVEQTLYEKMLNLVAVPLNRWIKRIKNGKHTTSPEEAAAWREHSHIDTYMTFAQLKETYNRYLPNGKVKLRRLLFWRYLLIYKKG